MPYQIFSEVFDSFSECHVTEDVFTSQFYREHIRKKLWREIVDESRSTQLLSGSTHLLSGLVSIITHYKTPIKIVDYGGGAGETYFQLSLLLQGNHLSLREGEEIIGHLVSGTSSNDVDYLIVDNSEMIHLGMEIALEKKDEFISFIDFREFWKKHKQVLSGHIAIIHLGSVLQYIDDWRTEIANLCHLGADFLLFGDVFAGDIESFVTLQRFYQFEIPFRFFNLDHLLAELKTNGYQPIFIEDCVPVVTGNKQFYHMKNFPIRYRIPNSLNLCFRKMESQHPEK